MGSIKLKSEITKYRTVPRIETGINEFLLLLIFN